MAVRFRGAMLVLGAMSVLLVAIACSGGEAEPNGAIPAGAVPGDGARTTVLAPIDGVEIVIAESFPPQYFVHIVSGLPSGCARFEGIEQSRAGDEIVIAVTNTLPADPLTACTMIYGTMEHSVALGIDFEPGREYTVRVNDVVETFVAQ